MIRANPAIRIAALLLAIGSASGFESRCDGQDGKPSTAPDSTARPQAAAEEIAAEEIAAEELVEQRRQFQSQELITAKPNSWIVNPAVPPHIVWRDVDQVRRLGCDGQLQVRWFDAELREAKSPNAAGRWGAWIEGTAPNKTPLRRSLTFYLPDKDALLSFPRFSMELSMSFPNSPSATVEQVFREHQSELDHFSTNLFGRMISDSEAGAILIAGMMESKPLGRSAHSVESCLVLNDDYHLALKLKLQGLRDSVCSLRAPNRVAKPAPVLHEGTAAEAGMRADAKAQIDAVCRLWAEETGEPFVTLVARHGVIVTHEAFGKDADGQPISLDYRCWLASITKSITALLFSRFLDQGLIDLDDSLSSVFPDYPEGDRHVPTFRQCFNHTSGLSGQVAHGGFRNPHLENVVLAGIDVNQPNLNYSYSGLGYELAMKAMEIVAGQSAVRLYHRDLFHPLGIEDVPIDNASSDGHLTAMELGVLAQLVANRGSYGQQQLFSEDTFQRLLPEPLRVANHGYTKTEGIGLHWLRHPKPDAEPGSQGPDDTLFSSQTVGHGSFSGCIFLIDLQQQIVIAQVRQRQGPRNSEWSARFFQTVAQCIQE